MVARIDRLRGLVPRETYIREHLLEQAMKARGTQGGETMRPHRVTGSLITVGRKTGPVYYLKARDRDGRQIKRKLGPVADWPRKQAEDALRDFLTDLGRVPEHGTTRSRSCTPRPRGWTTSSTRRIEHRPPSAATAARSTIIWPAVRRPAAVGITVDDVDELRRDLLATSSRRTAQKILI